MAAFVKFNSFVEALAEKVHNLGSDQLKLALTNTDAAASVTNYAGITSPLATTNLAGATPFDITTSTSAQTSGTYKLVLADLVLTASGGSVGPFRYAIIYNDTAAGDEVVCKFDYGSSITLLDGETLTIDFDGSAGVLTIA